MVFVLGIALFVPLLAQSARTPAKQFRAGRALMKHKHTHVKINFDGLISEADRLRIQQATEVNDVATHHRVLRWVMAKHDLSEAVAHRDQAKAETAIATELEDRASER